ncbi:MAG: hypothetical protein E7K80_05135 [Cutibacterium avidum]|nr:hypothetical protein [Cutibacterium avidum]
MTGEGPPPFPHEGDDGLDGLLLGGPVALVTVGSVTHDAFVPSESQGRGRPVEAEFRMGTQVPVEQSDDAVRGFFELSAGRRVLADTRQVPGRVDDDPVHEPLAQEETVEAEVVDRQDGGLVTARHAQLGVGHHGVTAMHEAVGQRHEDVVTGAQLVEQGDGLRPGDVPVVEVLPLLAGERHVGEGG